MKFKKMGGPKKKLTYYIVSLILVLLVLRGPINSLEGPVSGTFFPIKVWVYKSTSKIKEGLSTLKNYKRIMQENKDFKYEVAKIRILEKQTETLLEENERLHKLLGMKESSKTSFKVARINFKDSLTYYENVFIDLGETDGIKKDMVVMAGENLLGRVAKVDKNYSIVELVTKNDVYTSVLSFKNEVLGVLKGENSELMTMESVSVDKNIEVGEMIYTSGISDIYPKGIYVGRVESIGESRNQLFKDVKIVQDFNIFDINEVIIFEEE
ncbi:rod shape-determining protein MreC [uncultured Ilyobacter sp.]|uniref:rod shape-determining protein MreC n=1 Tax=uncultured Ilyobacter sp. TaxID=544433 RepID=UPI0029C81505|nr:rod shape-determining protein MreC [uncultured Ilyobacter sp.]